MNEQQYDLCLRDFLNKNFDLTNMRIMVDELKIYDRNIDPENFPQSKSMFSLELVKYLRRRGLTDNFIGVADRCLSKNVEPMWMQIEQIARQRGFK